MPKGIRLGLLAVLVLTALAEDNDDEAQQEDEDYVHVLTKDNFDETLKKHNRALVEFYAPWCGHCKELAPEYSKASKLLKVEEMYTILAKVDATKEEELATQYEVTSYPTLIYFLDGKRNKDYDGKMTADGITLWLKNKEYPPVKIMREDEVQGWFDEVEEGNFAMLARVKKGHSRKKVYYTAVEETLSEWEMHQNQIKFGVVWLPTSSDPKTDSSISFYRPGFEDPDPETINFAGTWTNKSVVWWAMNATYPSLGSKFTRMKYAPMSMDEMGWSASVAAVIDDATVNEEDGDEEKEDKLKPKVREALLPFVLENPQWKFSFADIEKLEDHELDLLATSYGSEAKLIWLGTNKKNYQLSGAERITDPEQIRQWISDIKAGKLKPSYKSAPAPESETDDDGVTIVTGKTFEEIAMDPDKDVFVEFYAPWCQHCQKLAPEWAKLAKKGSKAGWENVVIAKFDAVANECEEDVEGFPKLVLYLAVKAQKKMKTRQVYRGPRVVDSMFDFVVETAKSLEDRKDEENDDDEPSSKQKKKRKNAAGDDL